MSFKFFITLCYYHNYCKQIDYRNFGQKIYIYMEKNVLNYILKVAFHLLLQNIRYILNVVPHLLKPTLYPTVYASCPSSLHYLYLLVTTCSLSASMSLLLFCYTHKFVVVLDSIYKWYHTVFVFCLTYFMYIRPLESIHIAANGKILPLFMIE